jgi:hypothetical protein
MQENQSLFLNKVEQNITKENIFSFYFHNIVETQYLATRNKNIKGYSEHSENDNNESQ